MNKEIFTFDNFSKINNVICAVSTRTFGSMKDDGRLNIQNISNFLAFLTIPSDRLYLTEQVHGRDIAEINGTSSESLSKGKDGLITTDKNIFLGIMTADCLPILFYDCKKNIVGAVHAGYQGLNKLIIKNMIIKFRNLGSNIDNLMIGIGPGIGACCYPVDESRIVMFRKFFPSYDKWYQKKSGNFYLDLKRIAFLNLMDEGLKRKQIEISEICTMHHADQYFSYRKQGKKAGRFMSVIGMK